MTGFLYDLMYVLPLNFLAASYAGRYLLGEPASFGTFLLVLAFSVVFLSFRHLSGQMKIVSAGTVLIAAFSVWLIVSRAKEPDWEPVFRLLRTAGITLGMSLSGLLLTRFEKARLITAGLLAAALIVQTVLLQEVTGAEFAFTAWFALTALTEFLQRRRRGEGFDGQRYIVRLIPFILLFFLVLLPFKAPKDPYDWKEVREFWEKTRKFVTELKEKLFHRDEEDYNEAMIGFSDDGRIPGDVGTTGGEEIIRIDSWSSGWTGSIHLTGKVFTDFDGREWKAASKPIPDENLIDTLTVTAAMMEAEGQLADLYRVDSYTMTFLPFSTRHVFAPAKIVTLEMKGKEFPTVEKDGSLLFEKTMGINTTYRVTAQSINRNPLAIASVTAHAVPSEESWQRAKTVRMMKDRDDLSYERMLRQEELIRAVYGKAPEVSGRVQKALDEIHARGETDYERILILGAELRRLTYDTRPGALPEEVRTPADFLDHFLFDTQHGYCAHFATAYTLLARAMGYPARYVQGYAIQTSGNWTSVVRTDMAHAWTEIWMPGTGWMVFDGTPGKTAGVRWITSYEPTEGTTHTYQPDTPPIPDGEEVFTPEEIDLKMREPVPWYLIAGPVFLLLLFFGIFLLVDAALRRKRFDRADTAEQVRILSVRCMNLLRAADLPIGQGETLSEYGARIVKEVPADCTAFVPVFERYLYAKDTVRQDDVYTLMDADSMIRVVLKDRKRLLYLPLLFRNLHRKRY